MRRAIALAVALGGAGLLSLGGGSSGNAHAAVQADRFIVGLNTNVLTTVGVPKDRKGTQIVTGGMFWRYRLADWFSLGGSFMFGRDIDGEDYMVRAVRVEALSTVFDIPVHPVARPYMRLGIGWTSQTLDSPGLPSVNDPGFPYHAIGLFGVAAPGILVQPLPWLKFYAEFQSNVSAGGAPGTSDPSVQLGGEFGIGFGF